MVHPMLGEVAPAVPLLVPLAEIACLFVVLGILFMLRKFLEALLGGIVHLIPSLPLIGNPAADLVHRAEQAVSSALGSAEAAVDKRIGAAEHQLANLANWLWREFKAHANLLYLLAAIVGGQNFAALLRHAVARLTHSTHTTTTRTKRLERDIGKIRRQIKTLEQDYSKGIGADVLPRIKTLDREVARVRHRDIPAIRAGEQANAGEITNLWQWVKDHTILSGSLAFAGAVALALPRLGLSWIRCSKVGSMGRTLCGLPGSLFDDLLGLLADFFILTNVCRIIPILETVASDVGTPLVEGLTYVGAGLCASGSSAPAALSGPSIGTIPVYLA